MTTTVYEEFEDVESHSGTIIKAGEFSCTKTGF